MERKKGRQPRGKVSSLVYSGDGCMDVERSVETGKPGEVDICSC